CFPGALIWCSREPDGDVHHRTAKESHLPNEPSSSSDQEENPPHRTAPPRQDLGDSLRNHGPACCPGVSGAGGRVVPAPRGAAQWQAGVRPWFRGIIVVDLCRDGLCRGCAGRLDLQRKREVDRRDRGGGGLASSEGGEGFPRTSPGVSWRVGFPGTPV